MKKILLILLFINVSLQTEAQITLNTTYTRSPVLTKFQVIGYKYTVVDAPSQQIRIYNTNHSLYSTINIPATPLPINNVSYLSENLFDNDNQIEYALITYSTSPPPGLSKFYIFKENGTQLFFRDSASLILTVTYNNAIFGNTDPIFFDGTNTKMRLNVGLGTGNKYEIYTLPGTIPCNSCVGGIIAGKSDLINNEPIEPIFYPNPASDQLKLKYKLPDTYQVAEIKVLDMSGRLLETLKVTNDFEFIYLPSEYNSGLYLYSLIVDGVTIKTEKIVLCK